MSAPTDPDAVVISSPLDQSLSHSELSQRYIGQVNALLERHWREQRNQLAHVSEGAQPMFDSLAALTSGGKRMRALLAFWGWHGAGAHSEAQAPVILGAALELFHAAALIHDDVIDHSDTRRGEPSVHKRFEQAHRAGHWSFSAENFGYAAAILTGDLCLANSEELFAQLATATPTFEQTRQRFNMMRSEVMIGQYLDVLEENAGATLDPQHALQRAMQVLRYKSAQYSAVHPLVLGALVGGADAALIADYERFALPLGEAFQVRDDILGVFGDPEETGKPAGDDIREGKRTVLIAYALAKASPSERSAVNESLGSPTLSQAQLDAVREILVSTGALRKCEEMIGAFGEECMRAARDMRVDALTRSALEAMAGSALYRRL